MTCVHCGYVRVVTPARVYVATLLLVVVAFLGSFAIARALRDEPEESQPSMQPQMIELVELGRSADLPPLRAQEP
jgi:hypothetical protein